MIKLESPGPVFYRRRVMGVGGQEFDAFKFRTMYINGDQILAQHPELVAQLKRDYATVRHVKPASSRQDSSERYVLATGFRGQPNR